MVIVLTVIDSKVPLAVSELLAGGGGATELGQRMGMECWHIDSAGAGKRLLGMMGESDA